MSPESDYGLHRRRLGFKEEIRQWQDAQHQYSGTNPQPPFDRPVRNLLNLVAHDRRLDLHEIRRPDQIEHDALAVILRRHQIIRYPG